MLDALRGSGCRILHTPDPACPPYRITFETRLGERMGIIAYAFTITSRRTKGRPEDEARFQLKYGKKTGEVYELWQDPYGLYTTLLVGIDTEGSYFVGADPVLHSPTKFYISLEFKHAHVDQIKASGWHVWERDHRQTKDDEGPVEVLVGVLVEGVDTSWPLKASARSSDSSLPPPTGSRSRPSPTCMQWLVSSS
ncbi:hypothetical protein DYH09_35555 [bacterium CPR1]|nr:hypothetical protein [bacterium CPR1]